MRLILWAVVFVSSVMHCATEFDIVEREGLRSCGSWTAGSAWEDHDSSIGEGFAHAGEQTPLASGILSVPCTVPVGDARQAGTNSDLDTYACMVLPTPPGEVPVLRRDNASITDSHTKPTLLLLSPVLVHVPPYMPSCLYALSTIFLHFSRLGAEASRMD